MTTLVATESPRIEFDADSVAWVIFDDPESKVNILGFGKCNGST